MKMGSFWRVIYISIMSLLLAGIVHFSIVLLVPKLGTKDAWAYLSSRTDLFSFTKLKSSETGSAISEIDPFFKYGVCRFDLRRGGLKLLGPVTRNFWSASVFDDDGTVVYSLNNRTAIDNQLDLVIVSPLQALSLQEAPSEDYQSAVVIETGVNLGFVIVRILDPDGTWENDTAEFLEKISCNPFTSNS